MNTFQPTAVHASPSESPVEAFNSTNVCWILHSDMIGKDSGMLDLLPAAATRVNIWCATAVNMVAASEFSTQVQPVTCRDTVHWGTKRHMRLREDSPEELG
jgi:hypothetical protein